MTLERCVECGQIHCPKCEDFYRHVSHSVDWNQRWWDVEGVQHIVTSADRILCSGDRRQHAERSGSVPVQYRIGVSAVAR